MPDYRRCRIPGGSYFFTVNLLERRRDLLVRHVEALRSAVRETRRRAPFHIYAWVVLPDHLHCVWTHRMKKQKLLLKLLSGTKDIRFAEAVACAAAFGFRLDRVNGSHHIFVHPRIPELLNLQDFKGKAKPYQVKQLLQLIEIHNLQLDDEP